MSKPPEPAVPRIRVRDFGALKNMSEEPVSTEDLLNTDIDQLFNPAYANEARNTASSAVNGHQASETNPRVPLRSYPDNGKNTLPLRDQINARVARIVPQPPTVEANPPPEENPRWAISSSFSLSDLPRISSGTAQQDKPTVYAQPNQETVSQRSDGGLVNLIRKGASHLVTEPVREMRIVNQELRLRSDSVRPNHSQQKPVVQYRVGTLADPVMPVERPVSQPTPIAPAPIAGPSVAPPPPVQFYLPSGTVSVNPIVSTDSSLINMQNQPQSESFPNRTSVISMQPTVTQSLLVRDTNVVGVSSDTVNYHIINVNPQHGTVIQGIRNGGAYHSFGLQDLSPIQHRVIAPTYQVQNIPPKGGVMDSRTTDTMNSQPKVYGGPRMKSTVNISNAPSVSVAPNFVITQPVEERAGTTDASASAKASARAATYAAWEASFRSNLKAPIPRTKNVPVRRIKKKETVKPPTIVTPVTKQRGRFQTCQRYGVNLKYCSVVLPRVPEGYNYSTHGPFKEPIKPAGIFRLPNTPNGAGLIYARIQVNRRGPINKPEVLKGASDFARVTRILNQDENTKRNESGKVSVAVERNNIVNQSGSSSFNSWSVPSGASMVNKNAPTPPSGAVPERNAMVIETPIISRSVPDVTTYSGTKGFPSPSNKAVEPKSKTVHSLDANARIKHEKILPEVSLIPITPKSTDLTPVGAATLVRGSGPEIRVPTGTAGRSPVMGRPLDKISPGLASLISNTTVSLPTKKPSRASSLQNIVNMTANSSRTTQLSPKPVSALPVSASVEAEKTATSGAGAGGQERVSIPQPANKVSPLAEISRILSTPGYVKPDGVCSINVVKVNSVTPTATDSTDCVRTDVKREQEKAPNVNPQCSKDSSTPTPPVSLDPITNIIRIFQKKTTFLCSMCEQTMPTSAFWVNVVSQELLCQTCVSNGSRITKPSRTVRELIKNLKEAATVFTSDSEEDEGEKRQIRKKMSRVERIARRVRNSEKTAKTNRYGGSGIPKRRKINIIASSYSESSSD